MLDHEIGTHFVRKYNGKLQTLTVRKPKYPMQVRLESEEVQHSAVARSCYSYCPLPARVWQASIQS